MHKIQRNEPPEGLNERNKEFNKKTHNTKEITAEWSSFSRTELKKRTIVQLEKMFKGCCAYCEGKYKGTSFPQIEHFKPKSLYPELMFDYNNMILSCQECNTAKSNTYDEKLVNPIEDEPNEHLRYKAYMLYPLNERGKYTIDLLKLNSNKRLSNKEKGLNQINDRLDFIQELIDKLKTNDKTGKKFIVLMMKQTIKEIEQRFEDGFEYSTMYIQNFKDIIEQWKKDIE